MKAKQAVRELHKIKDDMNQAIKKINSIPGLEIQVEVLEAKADGHPASVVGIEISVMQEIYP